MQNSSGTYRKGYVLLISLIAAMGGVMFGFDLGVITGVIPFIQRQFQLTGFALGWVVAIFELGAVAGTFMGAWLGEKYGRKRALLYVAGSFLASTIGIAVSGTSFELSAWRFFQGVGVGAVSVLSPMYIAEIAPANIRGKLVSVNQLSIIVGFILSTISCYYFGDPAHLESWRWMFGSAIVPSILFFITLFFIPESPRWLIKVQQQQQAETVLKKIGDDPYVVEELREINDSLTATRRQGVYRDLFTKTMLPVVLIAFGIAILQQLSGANNVTAYLQVIFEKANISIKDGLLNGIFIGLVFFVFTLLGILLVDQMGRKKLMLTGTSLMALFLFLLAWSFNSQRINGALVFIFIMAYIGTYAFTLAPVTWVLLSEIFPNYIRGKALALASCVLWMATFVVVLVSPYLLKLSPVINFLIFAILNVAGIFFVWRYVPETKGKSLEEIEKFLFQKKPGMTVKIVGVCVLMMFCITTKIVAQSSVYRDGRPAATKRMACTDHGIVLRHGDGKDSSDIYGAREALVNKEKDTYYLFYDGAGKDGWKACLAVSKDLKTWNKKGPVLELGAPGSNDAKSVAAPWVIKNNGVWHMFYLGTPNTTPAPERIPAFPYLTMKAKARSLKGPWIKQYDVTPFTIKEGSFYSVTASPGHVVQSKGEFLQFFSAAMIDSTGIKRTLGIARTKDLNGSWVIDDHPLFPPTEQVENSSLYYEEKNKTWFLFTNHVGMDSSGTEYTDAIWVYWSRDLNHWDRLNKAIVLDHTNCTWSKGVIGMPTVIKQNNKLALLYDGFEGRDMGHMRRNIGLAWIELPINIPE